MAPPPPANLPLTERLLTLAKTLQFAWFVGHLTLILCITRYSFSWIRMHYYTRMAQLSYRVAFIAAAATYGIVVYKTLRARTKSRQGFGGPIGLLTDENVQYLLMALVWLFSPQYPLAMLPYGIYSVFHVATYTRANLIPTLSPPQQIAPAAGASPSAKPQYAPHPAAESIGSFVKEYYDTSMSVVSGLEILLWIRLLLAAIFFQRRSWILLALYTTFLRARFSQSVHVQNSFAQLEARVDNLTGAQGTPPAARQVWDSIKGGARQFHSVTDFNRFKAGSALPKKSTLCEQYDVHTVATAVLDLYKFIKTHASATSKYWLGSPVQQFRSHVPQGPSGRGRCLFFMTSLLRQIVAGPRAKHAETGLDLCYVTSDLIATSGPSQTYPQRAYRNPLDHLVAYLDSKHGDNWAIWEFRAEGTGYPDEAVYGRIRHYPWPDHHPPPFRLVPMIVASMRNWMAGGDLHGPMVEDVDDEPARNKGKGSGRVIVVHCKAGKGRSGTMACNYLISQRGWTPQDALERFTSRRMRPSFGSGVSIPSQLRTISYVDRWTRHGKKYVDQEVEIVEIHVWGLRNGVKVSVQGYVEEGKKIHNFHTFKSDERYVIEGNAPGGGGVLDMVTDMAGYVAPLEGDAEIAEHADYDAIAENKTDSKDKDSESSSKTESKSDLPTRTKSKKLDKAAGIMRKLSKSKKRDDSLPPKRGKTIDTSHLPAGSAASLNSSASASASGGSGPGQSQTNLSSAGRTNTFAASDEPGGQAVIFKAVTPVRVPNGDVNIDLERRTRPPAAMGLTMVTSVAHVWFNAFFEGNGPEQDGKPDTSGVFEIDWDKMDGIKGSSRRGTRAADRIAVVWRVAGTGESAEEAQREGLPKLRVEDEPAEGQPVPQMKAADWKGANREDNTGEDTGQKKLGLRVTSPDSADVSAASSITGPPEEDDSGRGAGKEGDEDSLKGVKTSGPEGGVLKVDEGAEEKDKGGDASKTAKNGFIIE
ncbi:uncharacterized protein E0L32_007486 [Thyridium curvatum]|uniref:phosphatidylinositol-3,4,5-trisphosphate 3-phosphatase n=1 Tax=Thyridium curvatum TaxID=1093900 RepID=A0A507B374_9PEZI|nr:uncharacterized protein E0L32_007486 [Thyridium curvatum]TPX11749.1 hypothetical protein E0L32_007486 [Thyridium curvatum]